MTKTYEEELHDAKTTTVGENLTDSEIEHAIHIQRVMELAKTHRFVLVTDDFERWNIQDTDDPMMIGTKPFTVNGRSFWNTVGECYNEDLGQVMVDALNNAYPKAPE